MKLSPRAIELLTLINDRTEWEGDERPGKTFICYFVPKYGEMWSPTLGRNVLIGGSGDATIFKSLERKRLTQGHSTAPYSYSITEDGILALAQHAEVSA